MSAITILTKLVQAGMTPAGACGMWGNIYAESSGISNIAQRGMTKLSDADYTAAADNGTINFVRDSVGYGLCQWTFWSRKQNLLNYAKSKGVSVGDENMQIEFLISELKSEYTSVWNFLCSTDSVYDSADKVCRQFERPAVNNVDTRATYGNKAYSTYGVQLKTPAVTDNNEAASEMSREAVIAQIKELLEKLK